MNSNFLTRRVAMPFIGIAVIAAGPADPVATTDFPGEYRTPHLSSSAGDFASNKLSCT